MNGSKDLLLSILPSSCYLRGAPCKMQPQRACYLRLKGPTYGTPFPFSTSRPHGACREHTSSHSGPNTTGLPFLPQDPVNHPFLTSPSARSSSGFASAGRLNEKLRYPVFKCNIEIGVTRIIGLRVRPSTSQHKKAGFVV